MAASKARDFSNAREHMHAVRLRLCVCLRCSHVFLGLLVCLLCLLRVYV